MAGGQFKDEISVDEFIKQADDYEGNIDFLDSIYKRLISFEKTHPFTAVRLKEIKKWVDNGEYDKILNDDYKKSGEGKEDYKHVFTDWKDSFENYKRDLHESSDPLNKIFSSVEDGISEFSKRAEDFFNNIITPGKKDK